MQLVHWSKSNEELAVTANLLSFLLWLQAALIEIAREHNLLETYAIPTTMYAMLESGFEPGADPFLQSMLLGYRQNCLLLLEDKAHVHVEKAALLMGVLDESGALEYGQAVVQSRQDDHVVPVVGTIAIAKNPCLHPGDVRILQAVRPPPGNLFLQGLVDCLVFPSRGPRPHPDECSGSDLDGDQYFVTWDPQLIPPRPHEPANYDAAQPLEKLDIKMDDICQFFIDYMKNDALGPICIAHLAFADVMPKKACDPICLELAKLQSLAVDYPKTGVPCKRNRLRHTPKSYPDFLKKRNKVTHESSQVLGELYRDIARKRPSMFGSGSRLTPEACIDRSLLIPGWKAYEATAQQVRKEYNQQLISVMKRYRIWREEEAVGGYMVKIASRHHRRQKLHDVQAQVCTCGNEFGSYFSLQIHVEELFPWLSPGNPDSLLRDTVKSMCAASSHLPLLPSIPPMQSSASLKGSNRGVMNCMRPLYWYFGLHGA